MTRRKRPWWVVALSLFVITFTAECCITCWELEPASFLACLLGFIIVVLMCLTWYAEELEQSVIVEDERGEDEEASDRARGRGEKEKPLGGPEDW